jgi:hypothetical protein
LSAATNARFNDSGINFHSRSEELLTCWFTSSDENLIQEDLRVEIGGFGVHAISLTRKGSECHSAFVLPPGLAPGWHDVRLRTVRSLFSDVIRVAADMPIRATEIRVLGAADSITWRKDAVELGAGGHLTLWMEGLAENADRNNVRVYWEQRRLPVEYVSNSDSSPVRQLNVRILDFVKKGLCRLEVRHGEARTIVTVDVC